MCPQNQSEAPTKLFEPRKPHRRGSHGKCCCGPYNATTIWMLTSLPDEFSLLPVKFIVNVEWTLKHLAEQEDTDGNWQITIDDHGPKASFFESYLPYSANLCALRSSPSALLPQMGSSEQMFGEPTCCRISYRNYTWPRNMDIRRLCWTKFG
jgi:hypothetical protein